MNSPQWRQRRRASWIEANRKRTHPDIEAERLIKFATMWAPYKGASEEEISMQFGMTRHRFLERLWQVIRSRDTQFGERIPAPPARFLTHPVNPQRFVT
ncbi:hypothetical protein [Rhodococcus sp. IEGM 1307]|uniref:hypothetical protein n=1 Tax=Rhodococcus sp. IEGM 1307 TaxID=3047091 RepID=UPI0024B82EB9|nr:hypothetical protein [Rhodococcus sp. IEGM 1307]MDI9977212.1 hypothetical protein [Rhodococcus sp. IEGM 1307]